MDVNFMNDWLSFALKVMDCDWHWFFNVDWANEGLKENIDLRIALVCRRVGWYLESMLIVLFCLFNIIDLYLLIKSKESIRNH